MKYSIQLASKLSGVGVHTIRAWEKRYDGLKPERSENGRREFSEKEIEKLTALNELCLLGHSIGKIAHLELKQLNDMLSKLGKISEGVKSRNNLGSEFSIDSSLSNMAMAVSNYKFDIIDHELEKLKLLVNLEDLIFKILIPFLNTVGQKIAKREMTHAHELAFNSLLKFHLGEIIFKTRSNVKNNEKIIVASADESYEEIPLLLMSILLLKKFNVIYLGPNVPLSAICDTAKAVDAKNIVMYFGRVSNLDTKTHHKKVMEAISKKCAGEIELMGMKALSLEDIELQNKSFKVFNNLKELSQLTKN